MRHSRRVMGIEAELSLTALDRDGKALPIDVALERFFDAATTTLPFMPRRGNCDVFLTNGMRLYRDCGGHPEVASPETTNPTEAVKYAVAMRHILADVVTEAEKRHAGVGEFFLTACNVNYANARATMGRHESYSYGSFPPNIAIRDELIPFLASRVILHGAGGLDPNSQGIAFLISPRAKFIRRAVSSESTSDRGLLHTKDETLAKRGFHRLHLIVGEYQCCQFGMWLTMGTTALLLSLAEAGIATGDAVQLRWPVRALQKFSDDTACATRVQLVDGRRLTAIEIQRHYLEQVERHCDRGILPPWAPEICAAWRDTLNRLEEGGGDAVADRLDWGVKLAVFKGHAERRYGFRWHELAYWSSAVGTITRNLQGNSIKNLEQALATAFSPANPVSSVLDAARGFLESKGIEFSRDRMADFIRLRAELFEIDLRFSQVGRRGVFDRLDGMDGLLHHRIVDNADIVAAKREPPQDTRAKLRGDCVRDLRGHSGYRCDWHTIRDCSGQRFLDLSDPFATVAQWQAFTEDVPQAPEDVIRLMHQRRRMAMARRETGPPSRPTPPTPPTETAQAERPLDHELLARILM